MIMFIFTPLFHSSNDETCFQVVPITATVDRWEPTCLSTEVTNAQLSLMKVEIYNQYQKQCQKDKAIWLLYISLSVNISIKRPKT